MKKNDLIELTIEDMSSEGLGIGHADGMAVFVKDAVVGDHVRARIVKLKKTYAFGRLEEIMSPGEDRVQPRCPVARPCGGCQIQEMSYPAQLRLKENKVRENLVRIGGFRIEGEKIYPPLRPKEVRQDGAGIEARNDSLVTEASVIRHSGCEEKPDIRSTQAFSEETHNIDADQSSEGTFLPIIGMEDPWHYRNKAQFPIGEDRSGKIIAGFYAGRTHNIIDYRRCEIGIEENQYVLEAVISWMKKYRVRPYDETTRKGVIRHVMTRAGFAAGELMVVIVAAASKLPGEKELVRDLQRAVEESTPAGRRYTIKSVVLNINKQQTNVILGHESRVLFGEDYIEDRIGPLIYRISSRSFYQVNPVQTKVLYETALEYASLTGKETVWDLYCGTGTISLFLAQRARKVIGVEVIPEAVKNAEQNARINHIDNCEFIAGRAEDLVEELPRADVIVVDPPRKGLDKVVIDTILKAKPSRIVYVSCDSATLARDLSVLSEGGYYVKTVQAVDQFCHSVHVETVCLLTHS